MKKNILGCIVLALFLAPLAAVAQTGAWSAVGSTGSIDEASLGIYAVGLNNLLHQTGAVGTVVSRFNVTNTYGGGITDTPPWTTLEMTYFDIDPASSVVAVLYKLNRCSNFLTFICGVTSVDSTAPACISCTFPTGTFNFSTASYVIEARVTRTAANSAPQLFSLRVF